MSFVRATSKAALSLCLRAVADLVTRHSPAQPELRRSKGSSHVTSLILLATAAAALLCAPPAVAFTTFAKTGALGAARNQHTATLLQNGKVLVAGGEGATGALASAELYDPATGIWTATGNLNTGREKDTATLLPNGKVLVAGGVNNNNIVLASAELYDPASGTWTATGNLNTARDLHTATLLLSGKVLVAGGFSSTSTELYDPASETWTATTGSLGAIRVQHTATLLPLMPNGKALVLVAGGRNGAGTLLTAELYDPASGTWTATTGNLTSARVRHTATLLASGKVLLAGGYDGSTYLATTELYDPATGTSTAAGSLNNARQQHTAALLPNGQVLVTAGEGTAGTLASAELFNPAAAPGIWTATGNLGAARYLHTATLLPNGKMLVAGGSNDGGYVASAELYDLADGSWTTTSLHPNMARVAHTATLLPNGKVLVAGGENGIAQTSAELFDPTNGTWTATGDLSFPREFHTATLLPNGKVLVAGGNNAGPGSALPSAELYDPTSGNWTATLHPLNMARTFHTATLLPNGKVLVAGGNDGSNSLTSAELYDPASGFWTVTGSLNTVRQSHTATLLPNGKVLVAGGFDNSSGPLPSAELYDPASGNWTTTLHPLNTAREQHTATLLPNGKVLVAGGDSNGTSAELFDPANGTWTAITGLNIGRFRHTATLLPNGKVLVAGGLGSTYLTSAELYDPASGFWTETGSLNTAREFYTATLLPNGKVLAAGGFNNSSGALQSAELYDVGLGFQSAWQPQITTAGSSLSNLGFVLQLIGSRFQGISQASGGNTQDSSTNYPIVQLRSIGNEQSIFLPPAGWSNVAFTSKPVTGFPPGPALATVFVNGIPSDARTLMFVIPTPTLTTQASAGVNSGGSISDTATLSGGNAPTGTITFTLYGPNDSSCGGASVFTTAVPVTGVGSYSSGSFTTTTPGSYRWVASYSGDANNNPVAGACNDANESVVVTPAPTPTPTPIPTPTPAPTATPTPGSTPTPGLVGNVSTRLPVGTGDNVLIEGFIVQGPAGSTKKIIVRAIGPSLVPFGITDALANPTLEIHDASNAIVASNDDWGITQLGGLITADQSAEIAASGATPGNDLESAIIADLAPGSYTAVVRGLGNTVGTGVVDAFDLSASSPARLANIATRGLIQPGDQLMIAGFIIQNGPVRAVVRAIGPSLSAFGITNALADTTLQLRDGNGAIVVENDDWKVRTDGSSQQAELEATGLQPTNDLEAAFVTTLQPGQYTAQVRGKPETTGIGVVQVYFLQ